MGVDVTVPIGRNEWIKYNLQQREGMAKKVGDFDGDGVAGTIKDYTAYYKKNQATIDKQIPFFKAAAVFNGVAGKGAHDSIHGIMSLVAGALKPQEVEKAYVHLAKAYRNAQAELKKCKTTEQKAKALVKAIGSDFKPLTQIEIRPHRVFNETVIFAAALAKHFGIKGISVVVCPREGLYLSFNQGNQTCYINSKGESIPEVELRGTLKPGAQKGVYLEPLDEKALIGMTLVNRGYLKMYRGQGPEAHMDYLGSKRFLPKSPLVWKSIGNLMMRSKHPGMGERCFMRALKLDPWYSPVLNNLGILEKTRKNNKKALEYFAKALKYEPNYPEAHGNICDSMERSGKFIEAIRHCNIAIKNSSFGPFLAMVYLKRGEARRNLDPNKPEYISDYTKAVRNDFEFSEFTLNPVVGYITTDSFSLKGYELAKEHVDEILAGNPKDMAANYMQAILHYKMGRVEAALNQFKATIPLMTNEPSLGIVYSKMAKIYYKHFNDPRSARDLLDMALDKKEMPSTIKAEMLFDSGVVSFALGYYQESVEDLMAAVKLDPAYAYDALGVVAHGIEMGDFGRDEYDLVHGLLSQAIDKDPANKKDYYYWRAKVSTLSGDKESAAKDAKRGSKTKPEFSYPVEVKPLRVDVKCGGGSDKIIVH